MVKFLSAAVAASLAGAACAPSRAAAADEPDEPARSSSFITRAGNALTAPEDGVIADPFEGFNRAMYSFNDVVDRAVLGPVSGFYEDVVPAAGRHRVRDFIDNWKSPVWLANDLLQGDFDHAGVTASRFALNTTVGVLGVYDFAAAHADLPKRDEDFGQTLAVHGMSNGAYLMLPVYGPTTFRDLTGALVDIAMDPFTWARFDGDTIYRASTRTLDIVDIRAQTEPAIRAVRDSVDPYAQARAVYVQSRDERIRKGVDSFEDLHEFE